jgi:hypothetical protein
MNVAITGATGFIGRALAEHLNALGYDCTALTRSPERARFAAPVRVSRMGALPAGTEAVIHFAGESVAALWTPWKRRAILASRVESTRALVTSMHAAPVRPRVFIVASAVGIYGHRPGELLDETSEADPCGRFRAQVCRAWEEAAREAESFGVRVVQLRFGNVLGPGGGFLEKLLRLYRLGGCWVLGKPDAALSWIGLLDCVRLVAFALENEAIRGPVNVTSPHAITQRTLATSLAQRLGKKVRGCVPPWLLQTGLGEFSRALLDDQRVVPRRAMDAGFHFLQPAWRGFLEDLFG